MRRMLSNLNVFVAITFLVILCNVVVSMAAESDTDPNKILSFIPCILAAGTNNTVPTVTSAGQIWMDRNLGASRVATSSTDSGAYGDLYQWGRGTDGHEKQDSSTTSTQSTTDNPDHGMFITGHIDWRTPQNDELWQGVSGINNPCPSGFRLPTATELDTERLSWGSSNSAGAFDSPLKLVVAGYSYYNNGTLYSAGSNGYYWSSTVNGSFSRNLYFNSGYAYMDNYFRANGFSVRCLKD